MSSEKAKKVCPVRRGDCLGSLCAWWLVEAEECAVWMLGRERVTYMPNGGGR